MADPIGELKVNPDLVVNAGMIYAKLHLAGKSLVKNYLVINSGMKNEENNATPENLGKSTFQLDNKSGEYEVCFIQETPIKWLFVNDKTLTDIKDKIKDKIKAEEEKQSATDNNSKIDVLYKDYIKQMKNFGADDLIKALKPKDAKPLSDKPESKDENTKSISALLDVMKELVEKQKQEVKESKKNAIKQVNAYFNAFAGEDYKDLTDNILMQLLFDAKVKTNKDINIKDFKIIGLDEQEMKKRLNTLSEIKVGFKVKYTLLKA